MHWTTVIWRGLCGLLIMSAIAACTGILESLPMAWQVLAVMPGLLVMALLVMEWWIDTVRADS